MAKYKKSNLHIEVDGKTFSGEAYAVDMSTSQDMYNMTCVGDTSSSYIGGAVETTITAQVMNGEWGEIPDYQWGGKLEQEKPAKEDGMKTLYRFYAVNRRTFVHLVKTVVGSSSKDEALNTILVENADEIKLIVGAPSDCVYKLSNILSFDPIEDKTD